MLTIYVLWCKQEHEKPVVYAVQWWWIMSYELRSFESKGCPPLLNPAARVVPSCLPCNKLEQSYDLQIALQFHHEVKICVFWIHFLDTFISKRYFVVQVPAVISMVCKLLILLTDKRKKQTENIVSYKLCLHIWFRHTRNKGCGAEKRSVMILPHYKTIKEAKCRTLKRKFLRWSGPL